jgi:acetolactate synthase-1/2/3 large subunit
MKNYLDGGEAIVQGFRNLGIEYVMTSPGSEWGAVWEAFARQTVDKTPGPTLFSCAHETLAVDLAIGYTQITGRMQAVMLHTGVGLLQGAVGIDAAQRQGIPMVVVSGESLTYGEQKGFDPGPQWQAALSVAGGTHRLVEPVVKWSNQATSAATLHEQLIRAGEMAQRTPAGPTYLCVPIETMLQEWVPPAKNRKAPPAPKPRPSVSDIEKVAGLLVASKNPVILAESAGRQPEAHDALVQLADLLAVPVVEAAWADYANFPKDHPLHLGFGHPAFINEADVVLTVRSRAPWYPPSNRPANAMVVAIDDTPFRPHMVHQSLQADIFLEGDTASTLELLCEAVRAARPAAAKVKERKDRWAVEHRKVWDEFRAAEAKARDKRTIDPIALCAALSDTLPQDAIYVDETITHRGKIMRHTKNRGTQSYFRVLGGLGQGLGVALGAKLANPNRPVVSVIGDGSFMYNPITQSLALSKHESLPILIVVFNNSGYEAMKLEHRNFYPDGIAAKHDLFYGKPITDFEYSELVRPFGGYGRRVEKPAELAPAIKEGMAAVKDGKTAILNVALDA